MQSIQQDQFCDPSYVDQSAAIAPVIVLNDQQHAGYFIPVSSMAKCGWVTFDEKELIEHTFRSGDTEQGILITAPRMLICPKTDLYLVDKKQTQEQKSKVILGYYNSSYKDNPDVRAERLYLVFFLDEDNNLLHTSPLKYTAHGVNGTTFALERAKFKSVLETCHALANGIPARPKNESFHCLGVFSFQIKAELVGDKQKSWCCKIIAHDVPTIQDWKEYFIGYSEDRDIVCQAFMPEQKLEVAVLQKLTGITATPPDDIPY